MAETEQGTPPVRARIGNTGEDGRRHPATCLSLEPLDEELPTDHLGEYMSGLLPTRGGIPVKWVTRERPKTDRIACPWLIRRFVDPDAEILYVPADRVLEVAEREGAYSFDAPGARYTHRDGLCSFEVLVEEYGIDDPAVHLLAKIVHGADVAEDIDTTPQSAGLKAVAEGFSHLEPDDQLQLALELPVYDALYEWCRHELEAGRA